MSKATYEVRVTVELLNHNVKSHRRGHVIKHRELKLGTFGDGAPNKCDRAQATQYANAIEQALRSTKTAVCTFAAVKE